MKVLHFDVDNELKKHLEGEVTDKSLQDFDDLAATKLEVISIKSASNANKETLSKFSNLKLLVTRTVGMDHIDIDYCKAQNIKVKNILDYGSFNIAEHVFALILSGARNVIHTQQDIHRGKFSYVGHLGVSLKGKTLGVVGTGKIGLEVIKRANGFEMDVLAYDVYKNEKAQKELGYKYVSLEELASRSDIITLHAPLLESTKHIINNEIIDLMKEGVILINTARGGLIRTQDLIKSIDKFRWVGLDVLEDEKSFSKDHPLLQFENVVITPHLAFYSDASVKKIASETKKLISDFI